MTKTSATIPITENDSNYYAGQAGPVAAVGSQLYSFPEFNTKLISNYDVSGGDQVRDTGNFQVHGLVTSTDIPGAGNLIPANQVVIFDNTKNGVSIGTAGFPFNFVFIQLTDIARGDNWGSYSYLTLNEIIDNWLMSYVGEDKIIQKIKRADVLFHARRAMQELSYDTLKSYKSQELTVPIRPYNPPQAAISVPVCGASVRVGEWGGWVPPIRPYNPRRLPHRFQSSAASRRSYTLTRAAIYYVIANMKLINDCASNLQF